MMLEATVAREARLVMADRPKLGDSTDAPELPAGFIHIIIIIIMNFNSMSPQLLDARDTRNRMNFSHLKKIITKKVL